MHASISEANQLALRTVSKRLVGEHKHPAFTFPIARAQPASLRNRNIKRKKTTQHRRHWISLASHSKHPRINRNVQFTSPLKWEKNVVSLFNAFAESWRSHYSITGF